MKLSKPFLILSVLFSSIFSLAASSPSLQITQNMHIGAQNSNPSISHLVEYDYSTEAHQVTEDFRQYDALGSTVATKKGMSGGRSGALESADDAYNIIRNSTDDVSEIAKNTGFKKSNIQKIKDHLFKDIHKKYDDYGIDEVEWGRLDSDINIANAWKRLTKGTHTKTDIDLLKHEMAERTVLKMKGPGTGAAHQKAHKRYPSPVQ